MGGHDFVIRAPCLQTHVQFLISSVANAFRAVNGTQAPKWTDCRSLVLTESLFDIVHVCPGPPAVSCAFVYEDLVSVLCPACGQSRYVRTGSLFGQPRKVAYVFNLDKLTKLNFARLGWSAQLNPRSRDGTNRIDWDNDDYQMEVRFI